MFSWGRKAFSQASKFLNRDLVSEGNPVMGDAPIGLLTYSPNPTQFERNDQYTQAYTWPVGESDRYKWYNNVFWGNRLPPSDVGIGIPGFNDVPQRLWWTQYSPEQTFNQRWSLNGGAYPYQMSVQQASQLMLQQQAAWTASAGHGV